MRSTTYVLLSILAAAPSFNQVGGFTTTTTRTITRNRWRRTPLCVVVDPSEETASQEQQGQLFDLSGIDDDSRNTFQIVNTENDDNLAINVDFNDVDEEEDNYWGEVEVIEDERAQSQSQPQVEIISSDEGIHAIDISADTSLEYMRDEDDILTEREDRLYTDESGESLGLERCILVGVEDLSAARRNRHNNSPLKATKEQAQRYAETEGMGYFSLEESMKEMKELIKTAGMEVTGEITQRLNEPNPRTYVGTGKLLEAEELAKATGSCTIIFDAELTPGQQKALENSFNKKLLQNDFLGAEKGEIKVIDRTALILDIFAQHAKTREGKLQVDLALHEYRKPRLTKMWTHLERQSGAGGVGLRGPGESQLEIDKRLIRDRIIVLKRKIDDVQKQRDLHRKGRHNLGLPILALVGYTNAGKSTLLNFLTRAGIMAEDILFATLDPTTRKVKLPGYKTHPEVLLTDTVGFIQKLPTHLVAAFRATLEEVRECDVLVHVIDVSNSMWEKQEAAVNKVLMDIGAGDKPVVRVFNKIDLLGNEEATDLQYEAAVAGSSVAVSSITGEGMEDFVAYVEEALCELLVPIEVEIPFDKGDELNLIHEVGHVETVDYRATGTYIAGLVPKAIANRLIPYFVNELNKNNNDGGSSEDDDEIDWVAIGRGRHSAKGQ